MSKTPADVEVGPGGRVRRWPRRLALAALALALAAGAVRAALPFAIEQAVAWAVPRYVGLPARVANVDLGLFAGRLAVEGLVVGSRPGLLPELPPPAAEVAPQGAPTASPAERAAPPSEGGPTLPSAEGEPPPPAAEGVPPREEVRGGVEGAVPALVRFDRVFVRIDWGALLERTLQLRELAIEGPVVRLVRLADGRIDPLARAAPAVSPEPEVVPPPSEPEVPPAAEEPSPPWRLAVDRFALRRPDVKLVEEGSGALLVDFGLEEFELSDLRVAEEAIALGDVDVRAPRVRVKRDFVLGGGTPAQAPPPAPEPAAAAPAPARATPRGYRAERVAIDRVEFTLLTDAGALDLAVSLEARGVTADEGKRFPLELELEVEDGHIALDGELGVVPPAWAGTLEWSALPFPPLLLASTPELSAWIRSCRASGTLELEANLGSEAPGVAGRGRIALEDLSVADPKDEEVALGWKSLEIAIRELRAPIPREGRAPEPIHVALERVALAAPEVRYTLPSPSLDALLRTPADPQTEPADAPATSEAKPAAAASEAAAGGGETAPEPAGARTSESEAPTPLALEVGAIEVADGALRFEDRRAAEPSRSETEGLRLAVAALSVRSEGAAPAVTVGSVELGARAIDFEDGRVSPPYRGGVRNLVVAARDVRTQPELGADALRVTGVTADGGTFALRGALRGAAGDATLELERLPLAGFNPYAASAGYELGGGASLVTRLRVRGPRYDTRNEIVLHELAVSSRDPADFERRFGLPLDLALALLRDPSGNISLTVPVAADEKGVSTGIGTIVAGALRQALVGALTSPLKLVGAAFRGGEDRGGFSLDPLASEPGSTALAAHQDGRLEGAVKLLAERPALGLRLRGRAGPEDRPRLAEQILAERVVAGEGLPPLEDVGFFARRRIAGALEARARGEAPALEAEERALLDRYAEAVDVPAARFEALARGRAEQALAAIAERRAGDRTGLAVADPAADGAPGVVLEFAAR